MTAAEIFFRCSSLGHLMPGPREKEGTIQKGTITHLVDVYVSAVWKRRDDILNKYLEKGTVREEDSITLLSRVTKKFFKKNDQRLFNDWITGEPDIFQGAAISHADVTYDTKTSWSATTFFRAKNSPLDDDYYWQGMGYMDLTGAKEHNVAYCLVNSPANLISDEKYRLAKAMGVIDGKASDEYKKRCQQIEINHIFDMQHFIQENPGFDLDSDLKEWSHDIPMKQRVHIFNVKRDDAKIKAIHDRVDQCRKYMEETFFKNLEEGVVA